MGCCSVGSSGVVGGVGWSGVASARVISDRLDIFLVGGRYWYLSKGISDSIFGS